MTVLPFPPPVSPSLRRGILALQAVTLLWMIAECGLSLYSAAAAKSPVLLAFGSDSLIELLSAALVVLSLGAVSRAARRRIDRAAAVLLFVLAGVVALVAALALAGRVQPEPSRLGIAVAAAALVAMPLLAWQKRKLARRTGNRALAADAVQSATCAWLALITLAGLGVHALGRFGWADSVAALAAVPLLIVEGRRSLRGEGCGCCH